MSMAKTLRPDASYAERREAIYGPLRQEGIFTWDCLYGQEYALAGLYRLERAQLEEMRRAAEKLGRIYAKTVRIVQQGEPALLAELGLPPASFGAIRLRFDEDIPTLIGRFDFALTSQGLKMLEFNSDTPTGIVEAFHVNGRVCAAYGEEDPNESCSGAFRQAFKRMLDLYREAGYTSDHVVFSSLDWHEEDAGTTRYLMKQSGIAGAEFAALSDLRVEGDRIWAQHNTGDEEAAGRPIDVMYRLHAIEKLAEDRDTDGYPTGEHVLDLIADGKLAIINPPSGFAAQTKALQALIWNLHQAGEFYTEEEHETIEAYMLPTFMEPCFPEGTPYVMKPILGREGSGVTIYKGSGEVAEASGEDEYGDQLMVYQQYAELPRVRVETLDGPYDGRLLWGCFLIDGRSSAVIARVGGSITNNLSYYLPSSVIG
ncbi:glutathionylspermidine synthase family protein [Paenibacillus ehimensis]|uniref:glutathionylspermidine synthase family protein n=1 Tax=Paenibacillus ehimensis TaxID=79264 RepID=UPI002DBF5108|nr:glutathionylspermidine synthase family protein [Paenibacillus ehimensis]MEC0213113.1 glutathionylspermidine synthase family protein [Paenibacillus ehimensis]